ncbi:MAG: DUF4156 domain-containing protein [Gammaproteobacteria bacterium]|nr:DUF4156 domain-containing protein [Gammaproteobacteria bacterium]
MNTRFPLILLFSILATGCVAAPLLSPDAGQVLVTRNVPAEDCVFVGEVLGSQGNFWTAEFTSDEDLIRGARNRMRDKAYNLGANFVQIEMENQSQNTADESLGGVFSSVIIGNAYACPKV